MREDIRRKMYKEQYKLIDDLYCNKYMTITDACKKIGISSRTYQNICKELNRPSVAKPLPKKEKVKKRKINQRGGNEGVQETQNTSPQETQDTSKEVTSDVIFGTNLTKYVETPDTLYDNKKDKTTKNQEKTEEISITNPEVKQKQKHEKLKNIVIESKDYGNRQRN